VRTLVAAAVLALALGLRLCQQNRWWQQQDAVAREIIEQEKVRLAANRPVDWIAWSSKVLNENLAEGRLTIVSVIADWDPSCHLMERMVLESPLVQRRLRKLDAVLLRADYSDCPEDVVEYLKAIKSDSVPTVVLYPSVPPYEPIVQPGVYRKEWMLDALDRASGVSNRD